MKKITLLQMKINQKGKIADICGGQELLSRLMSMGLYPGREITKVGQMALKGAVTIEVGRSLIALGHGMAAKVILEAE